MRKFRKIVLPSAYGFWMGIALPAFFKVWLDDWQFWATIVPVVVLVALFYKE